MGAIFLIIILGTRGEALDEARAQWKCSRHALARHRITGRRCVRCLLDPSRSANTQNGRVLRKSTNQRGVVGECVHSWACEMCRQR